MQLGWARITYEHKMLRVYLDVGADAWEEVM